MSAAPLKNQTKNILFEIQTEELPATNLADIFESGGENILESRARKAFGDARITFGPVGIEDLQPADVAGKLHQDRVRGVDESAGPRACRKDADRRPGLTRDRLRPSPPAGSL